MNLKQSKSVKIISMLLLFLLLCITVFPLFLMLQNSFKTRIEIATNPLAFPKTISFINYKNAWKQAKIPAAAVNSIILVIGTLALTLFAGSAAAYVLANKKIRFWPQISVYFLVCNTIPKQLFIIPLFFILQKLNLINNLIAMMFIYSALYTPFAIFLLRTYFIGVNKDIINSAIIDGASKAQIFLYILVPLIQPGLLTAALIIGLWCWNEFLFSVTFLQKEAVTTLAVRFYAFSSRYVTEWGNMMAFAVFVSLPIIIFFLFLQRYFIDGMTVGSVKG
ncbi:carbohydrate ABC transporter permease [Treponema sp. HNW]|uniref:carbohydrate ABC transporter permease n=1 Tax=Treponema sp. HNW TaxID=3116654 RepID=UPI003D0E1BF9